MSGPADRFAGIDRPHCRCLWAVYLRSLSLQGSWNPQRMQNLGLVVTLLPWLKRAGLPTGTARKFCRRHYEYFNTNPYYANLLVGGLLRLEEENRQSDDAMLQLVGDFKDTLGRALASLGDQFFWLGLQPALLVLASLAAAGGWTWIPLALLGAFTLLQLTARKLALIRGYELGLDIVDLLGSPRWHAAIWAAKRSGALLTGILAGLYAARLEWILRSDGSRNLLLGTMLALGLSMAVRRRWPGESMLLVLLPLALIMTYL